MRENIDPSKILAEAAEALSLAQDLDVITSLTARAARDLSKSDGATFVLSEGENCFYVDEDAISPLWKGKRFPKESCVSGWSMKHREMVFIPDVNQDDRVPIDVYRATFVKSICMIPLRAASPIGALGVYWAKEVQPKAEELKFLQALANCASIAVENFELRSRSLTWKKDEKKLLAEREELESVVYGLAHDLRNPLCTMLALVDLLRNNFGDRLDVRATQYLDSISKVGLYSSHLINQMLTMYRLSGAEINRQSVDLTIIGRELESQIRMQTGDRSIEFKIDEQMQATGDPVLLRLMVENLFVNAVKFSKNIAEAKIHFGVEKNGGGLKKFFVKDNGAGFEAGEEKKLFRPQIRLHSEKEFPGTGLGLSSVARIIEAHGGSIFAESKKGKGATFYFLLPQ